MRRQINFDSSSRISFEIKILFKNEIEYTLNIIKKGEQEEKDTILKIEDSKLLLFHHIFHLTTSWVNWKNLKREEEKNL